MVNHKALGYIVIGISVIFAIALIIFKIQVDNLTAALMVESGGSCIQNGECLHEQSNLPVYIGIAITFVTFALGLYLIFFEKTKEKTEKIHKEIVNTLKESKKKQDKDEKFSFLLKALNEEEQEVMKAVKEQDGIEQSTLRIRTDLSKTKLSVILSDLDKKNLVRKVKQGKKNKIYLKNAF